jgi:predicted nucleic acid-binding protein
LSPEQVFIFVEQIVDRLKTISLDESVYLRTIHEFADRGHASVSVYDALLLACARKADARAIYTWNLKHFRRIAPDLADRIRTP